jgi:hypothetical protein
VGIWISERQRVSPAQVSGRPWLGVGTKKDILTTGVFLLLLILDCLCVCLFCVFVATYTVQRGCAARTYLQPSALQYCIYFLALLPFDEGFLP